VWGSDRKILPGKIRVFETLNRMSRTDLQLYSKQFFIMEVFKMEHIETWDEMMAGKPDLPNYHPHYARQQAAKGRFKKPEVSTTMTEISNHEASEGGIKIMVTGKDFDERLTRLEKKHGLAAGRVESPSIPAGKPELVAEDVEGSLVNGMLGMVGDANYVPRERILTEAEQAEDDLVNGLVKMSDPFYQGAKASKVDSKESDEDSLVDDLVKMAERRV
jgi:hypothetical protein